MPPTLANGKICYVELPAIDVERSSEYYEAVFGWQIRRRGDGQLAFDDTVGEVSGAWVTGRPPSTQPGLLLYVMVDSVAATLEWSSRTAARSCSRSVWTRPRSLRESATPPET